MTYYMQRDGIVKSVDEAYPPGPAADFGFARVLPIPLQGHQKAVTGSGRRMEPPMDTAK